MSTRQGSGRRGRPAGRTIRLVDPEALAAAVGRAYQPGRGNRKRAAEAVGLSDDTLAKMEKGALSSIGPETVEKLYRLVPEADHVLLDVAILPGHAMDLLKQARSRTAELLEELATQRAMPPLQTDGRMASTASIRFDPVRFFDRGKEIAHLIAWARALPGDAAEFERLCRDQGHDQWRVTLAWYRIVSPLVEYQETGHIERAWWEIPEEERRAFVDAGLRRERILLNRPDDERRALQVLADDLPRNRPSVFGVEAPAAGEPTLRVLQKQGLPVAVRSAFVREVIDQGPASGDTFLRRLSKRKRPPVRIDPWGF